MKNIVLCSDGTGNKGGYGEDTNVYKIYKAVDIHHAEFEQITFYDQGVGTDKSDTNKNKYLTALSAAFGFGFKDNVCDLYHFLARSYNVGDSIFLFGFSRGAATVRAFTGFINACGLVDRNNALFKTEIGSFNEQVFREMAEEAFRCYESDNLSFQNDFKSKYAIQDDNFAPQGNLKIKFIGVWDTVSALGFPNDFSWLVQGLFQGIKKVSNEIWPHEFYNYNLTPSIENAYQALAIDDERKTFKPMVWQEKDFEGDVQQIWFAGVHSNVGGGYPRTGLSDVALEWMITKAEAHGLVFYTDHKNDIKESANIHDKLYDSRDGIALYYRYGPRNLKAICRNKLKSTITLHDSAYKKIIDIGDPYAPDGLPSNFNVVDTLGATVSVSVNPANQADWNTLEIKMKKMIQNRICLYRLFVESTMLVVILSGILWLHPEWLCASVSCTEGSFLAGVATFLQYLTPVYFENFITYVVCIKPFIFPSMLAALYVMNELRKYFINTLDDTCRKMNALLHITPPTTPAE